MHELLDPQFKDIASVYATQFAGMVRKEIPVAFLCQARERLVNLIRQELDKDEKRFLLSMKQGEPEWDILGIKHLKELPALQWKLQNIRRMEKRKQADALKKLQRVLDQ